MRGCWSREAADGICEHSLPPLSTELLDAYGNDFIVLLSLIEAEVIKVVVNEPDYAPEIHVAFISEKKIVF